MDFDADRHHQVGTSQDRRASNHGVLFSKARDLPVALDLADQSGAL